MIDLKPYGAFIEHTIRPLIDELNKLGFKVDQKIISLVVKLHIFSKVVDAIVSIITIILVCLTVYLVAK